MERVADVKRRAQIYIQQGRWDEAIRAYEKLVQASDPDPYLHVLIGDVHLRRGDPASATASYQQAIGGYRETGLLKNAVAVAKKLLRCNQERREVLSLLAELNAQDGLSNDAAAYYAAAADEEVVAGRLEEAAVLLAKGVAVAPMHADCSNRLVDLCVDLGRPEAGARELLRLAEALRMAGHEDPVPFLLERARGLDPSAELPSVEPAARVEAAAEGREALSDLRGALSGSPAAPPAQQPKPAAGRLEGLESTGPAAARTGGAEAPPAGASAVFDHAAAALAEAARAEQAQAKAASQGPAREAGARDEAPAAAVGEPGPSAPATASAAPAGDAAEAPAAPSAPFAPASGKPAAAPEGPAQAQAEPAPPEPAAEEPAAGPAEPRFAQPEPPARPRATSRSVSVKDEVPAGGALIDLSKILEEFKQGLEQQIGPDDAKSHYDMAMAYMEMNLLGDAVAELAAASHDPELRPKCCELLGQCYLRQGRPEEAERILRRGLETHSLGEEAGLSLRYHLALALELLGNDDEARELLEQVIQLRPDFMDAAQHLESVRLRRAS
ncbi:MAG TPA: tetratricopeptide repeat protein [Candidatus Saccharimonadales bacterium]|nr:tetratricopeptide repeat protein [Candidatus Saccharimonadales bacterium]